MDHTEVVRFWFEEIDSKCWWQKDDDFDSLIRNRFGALHSKASACELYHWRDSALGSLAEIIVLDQFSRNIYRDRTESFASDSLALALSQIAIAKGLDANLSQKQRSVLFLPFMHSESHIIHIQAVKLYESVGNPTNLEFELKHKAIIDRFGRYPHRNAILGRESTQAELAFLQEADSSF